MPATDETPTGKRVIRVQHDIESDVRRLRTLLADARRITVISGAGVSTESGIPDFRSDGGWWQDEKLVETLSDAYLRRHPDLFWERYRAVFLNPDVLSASPNAGHRALVNLEASGRIVHIYTQNVDGLHQAAGSQHVFEVHGSNRSAYCSMCHSRYGLDKMLSEAVPRCTWENMKGNICNSVLVPDTVLFGQPVRYLEQAMNAVIDTDVLLVVGTSLTVEPVASLPRFAVQHGVPVAIINLTPTPYDTQASVVLQARLGEGLPAVTAGLDILDNHPGR
ncbi:MAG: NAD-dependent protein deacylase [Alicyclobacillus sp.]|nr:NAD-dependent protein deacylase [Alicyclobacillus sp.]